jgi:hypothetical protein
MVDRMLVTDAGPDDGAHEGRPNERMVAELRHSLGD